MSGQWGNAWVHGRVPSPPERSAEQRLQLYLLEHKPQETARKSGSKHLGGLAKVWMVSLECFGNQA